MARFFKESLLAFVVSGLMLPGAIAVATVFLFLTVPLHWAGALNRSPGRVCLFGALIGLAFCVLLALTACRRFTRAATACPGPFDQLRQGIDDLGARVRALPVDANPPAALRDALEHVAYLEQLLSEDAPLVGLPWLLASGYVDAWRRLHMIESALLLLEPTQAVVRSAFADEMRLTGSSIPQNAALLKRLRSAVGSLSPSAARYLSEAPPPPPANTPEDTDGTGARAALAQVRDAINEFRDGRREALIRARNRLFGVVLFAGLTGCTLLFVAILSGATKDAILAASAFYLVGGIVGLVKELQNAGNAAGTAQDDYGLGVVRLIQTPLLAGLAAIGGVVLIRLTQGQVGAGATASAAKGTSGAAGGTGSQTAVSLLSLKDTFDLRNNPYGLVAAAFFGLTPSLLLAGLQNRIDQYRSDLSKSAPAESGTPAQG